MSMGPISEFERVKLATALFPFLRWETKAEQEQAIHLSSHWKQEAEKGQSCNGTSTLPLPPQKGWQVNTRQTSKERTRHTAFRSSGKLQGQHKGCVRSADQVSTSLPENPPRHSARHAPQTPLQELPISFPPSIGVR